MARPPKLESISIVTRCDTAERFVAMFHRFCDAKTCFIPSAETRPVGSPLAFSLRLVDGTPMLRGTCVVKAAWTTADNPFKRPGVQLEIVKLTTESEAVFEQLLAQKTAVVDTPDGVVQPAPHETTNQHVPRDKALELILRQGNAPVVSMRKRAEPEESCELPTLETPPVDDERVTRTVEMPPLYKTESRAAGSAFVLPANPLTDLDDGALDDFLACSMAEENEGGAIEDELGIPVAPAPHDDATARCEAPPVADGRDPIATLLGMPPLPAVRRDTEKTPKLTGSYGPLARDSVPERILGDGTQPLALPARPPATATALHGMAVDRLLLCSFVLLVVAIGFASAFVLAS